MDPISLFIMALSYLLSMEIVVMVLEFLFFAYAELFLMISPIGEFLFGPAWQWAGILLSWPQVILMLLLGHIPVM